MNVDEEKGVPLEQLISFIRDVEIFSVSQLKFVRLNNKLSTGKFYLLTICKSLKFTDSFLIDKVDPKSLWNPLLVTQLNILSNELVDLLKLIPTHRLPISKFNYFYFQHFGRHCKVSDYGFNQLLDLLEAMPHVVHVRFLMALKLLFRFR